MDGEALSKASFSLSEELIISIALFSENVNMIVERYGRSLWTRLRESGGPLSSFISVVTVIADKV